MSTWLQCPTFPLQVVAVVDELERIRLVGSLNVVHVDVQVIGCFQEVVGEHRALALIQGQIHVRGHQSATLPLTHIQSGGRNWRQNQSADTQSGLEGRPRLPIHLLFLLSVRPQEVSPSSGSGLQGKS